MRPHLLASLLLVLLSPSVRGQALPRNADGWLRVTVGQYDIITDVGERRARGMAQSIDRLAAAVGHATSLRTDSDKPVRIFAFRRSGDFRPYRDAILGPRTDKTGVFSSRRHADYILLDTTYDRMEPLLYHELTHSFVRNTFPQAPLWLNEGLAELFGTFDVRGGRVLLGLPDPETVALLRREPLVPMAEMLEMTGTAERFRQGPRARVIYAQSWAMVHYLLIGNESTRTGVNDFLKLNATGVPSVDAFSRAFGMTAEQFEKEIFGYVRGPAMHHLAIPPRPRETSTITSSKLSPSELLAELGTLMVDSSREMAESAEVFLTASLRLDDRNAMAQAALGDLFTSRGQWTSARERYEMARKLDPGNRRAAVATGSIADPSVRQMIVTGHSAVPLPDFGNPLKDLRELRDETLRDLEAAKSPEERERLEKLFAAIEGQLGSQPSAEKLYTEAIGLANAQKIEEALERIEQILSTTQPGTLYHIGANDLKRQIESQRSR